MHRRVTKAGYALSAALVSELVLTFGFLIVITGATDQRSTVAFAPLAIGLALTMMHLVSIRSPTHRSIRHAARIPRTLSAAGRFISWLFWVAPIAGAALAGLASRWAFVHSVEDRSPGLILDKPVEVLVRQVDGIAPGI
jgi:aquaporin Z